MTTTTIAMAKVSGHSLVINSQIAVESLMRSYPTVASTRFVMKGGNATSLMHAITPESGHLLVTHLPPVVETLSGSNQIALPRRLEKIERSATTTIPALEGIFGDTLVTS